MTQLLRLRELHTDAALEVAALRCLCHLCFSSEALAALRRLPEKLLEALLQALLQAASLEVPEASKLAQEAMARILVAEAEAETVPTAAQTARLSLELFRQAQQAQHANGSASALSTFKDMLLGLAELVPAQFLAGQLLAAAPVTERAEEMAMGWLALLLELLETNGELAQAVVSEGVAMATTSLMDLHASTRVQATGVDALKALAP